MVGVSAFSNIPSLSSDFSAIRSSFTAIFPTTPLSDEKRGGWQWQQTQMQEPARVARLWLALAVATLWMISVGSDLEVGPPAERQDLPDLRALLDLLPGTPRPRRLRLFRLGWLWLLVQALRGDYFPLPTRLCPEPWPDVSLRLEPAIYLHHERLAYAVM